MNHKMIVLINPDSASITILVYLRDISILENLTAYFYSKSWCFTENRQKTIMSLDKKLPEPHIGAVLA